ncbi:MAG: PQQ-binding-like beta-propeller repeat protein [Pirellulales bacterium]|nr:PQQ-binding-like beta-propeller repeat protein [Pirellulales bacterium]
MMIRRRTDWLLCAGLALAVAGATPAEGQSAARRFELADAVQLDRVDNAVRARLERVEALLADRQWDEAVDILRKLAETPDDGLIAVSERRFVGLRDWCQMRLAALPPEALKIYRDRIDSVARQWYEQGVAERNHRLLQQVVDRAFAGAYGDDALMALGEINLESGDFAAARWCWRRILPPEKNTAAGMAVKLPPQQETDPLSPFYPDTDLDPAAVRARLVLTSILEGAEDRKKGTGTFSRNGPEGAAQKTYLSPFSSRARAELAQFARLHPDAQGRLGKRRGKFVDLLESLFVESATWPAAPSGPDWLTFAGNPRRNRVAAPLSNVGSVAWRIPLSDGAGVRAPRVSPLPPGEGPGVRALCFHPLSVGNLVLANNQRQILAVRLDDGTPAWGRSPAIYRSELAGVTSRPTNSTNVFGTPRFTMTVFRNRLFARMGSPVLSSDEPGYLVCLDLAAEGRLLWKIEPEEGWAFEGSPLADALGVYVAMHRLGVRPRTLVACLDADTGRIRWRRFVCGAETPAQGALSECSHNLLTLAEGTIYFNTNLGAVAALRTDDGRISWLSLYPRELNRPLKKGATAGSPSSAGRNTREDTAGQASSGTRTLENRLFPRAVGGELAPHWRRDLTPCLFDGGTLLVAPADSSRIFAFDASSGRLLWQTGPEVEDAVGLLGATDDHLIAAGGKLYWIGLKGEDRGRVKHVWPSGAERPGYGRGLLAGRNVLWPTRDKLYIFDQQTAKPLRAIDLAMRGAAGGNLLTADGKLLIATDTELIAINPDGGGFRSRDQISRKSHVEGFGIRGTNHEN